MNVINLINPEGIQYDVVTSFSNKNWVNISQKKDGKQIGLASLLYSECRLEALNIAMGYQRLGYGTKLFKKAEDFLEEKRCTHMYLEAIRAAAPFYEKQGAYRTYEEFQPDNDLNVLLTFRKKISKES